MMKYTGMSLELFGELEADFLDIIEVGQKFICALYKAKHNTLTMNTLRPTIFTSEKDTSKIQTLPPTDDALKELIKCAHLQTMIWKAADQPRPPDITITDFGWDIVDGIPNPRSGVSEVAPADLMKVIACGCSTQTPCSRGTCSCQKAGVSCTTYCKCMAQDDCNNPHTVQDDTEDSTDDNEEREDVLYDVQLTWLTISNF